MPLVSITRLHLRRWRFLPMFLWQVVRSVLQAKKADGNLVTRLFRDRGSTFWTGTVWTNEAAMKGFMLAGAHGRVMRRMLDWCDEAAVVHWTQEHPDFPAWENAHARMQREGRPSKVNHPSPAHSAFAIPQPRIRRTSELPFK